MSDFKRKKVMLVGLVVLAVCVGVINNKLAEQRLLQTSADYVKYEGQMMREYEETAAVVSSEVDTDQLLDDEGAWGEETAEAADPQQSDSTQGTPASGTEEEVWDESEGTLVSSDNFAELNDKTTYFEEARAALNMDRNEILSMLTEYAEESEDEETKDQAEQQKLTLIEYMSKEKTVENLLKNKGFADAYVVMTDNAVNITVNKETLTPEDIAKAVDIATRETGRPASQIVIQNKL